MTHRDASSVEALDGEPRRTPYEPRHARCQVGGMHAACRGGCRARAMTGAGWMDEDE